MRNSQYNNDDFKKLDKNTQILVGDNFYYKIHLAAELDKTDIIKELIDEQEEKIDRVDSCGRTALHYAVNKGRLAAVKLLLAKSANVNAVDNFHTSPVTDYKLLSRLGEANNVYTEIMKLLILYGAQFNLNSVKNKKVETAIYNFLCGKSKNLPDKKIVNFLLESGVDINKEILFDPVLVIGHPNIRTPLEQIIIRKSLGYFRDSLVETLELLSLYLTQGAIIISRFKNHSVFDDFCIIMSVFYASKNQKIREILELTLNNFIEAGALFIFDYDMFRIPDIGILKFLYHRGMPFDSGNLKKCINENSNFIEFKNIGTVIDGSYYNKNFLYSLINSFDPLTAIFPRELAQLTLDYLEEPKTFSLILADSKKNRNDCISEIYRRLSMLGYSDYFKLASRTLRNSYLLNTGLIQQFITRWAMTQAKNKHTNFDFGIILNVIFNFVDKKQQKMLMQIYLRLCASNYSNKLTLLGLTDSQRLILDDFVEVIRLNNNSCYLNLSDQALESLYLLEPSDLYDWIKDNLNRVKVMNINLEIKTSYPDLCRWLNIISDSSNNIFDNVKNSIPKEKIKHTAPIGLFEGEGSVSQEIKCEQTIPSASSSAQPESAMGSVSDVSKENYTDHPLYQSGYRFHCFAKPKNVKPTMRSQSTSSHDVQPNSAFTGL